jgi:arsenate reductase
MTDITIYHNPRCSKSRQTLALIEERGVTPTIIEYLQTPPDAATLGAILDMLGIGPRDLMRNKEDPYCENNLDEEALTRENLIDAMIDNPILIERPIVVSGAKAVVGRPPENVLELL